MTFKKADDEFQQMAQELFVEHKTRLNLMVDPVKVIFLRSDKKKNAYAYCKLIGREYALLTDKKYFIVVVSQNYDELDSVDKKRYVILHELMHLFRDDDEETGAEKYKLLKHNIEDFHQLLMDAHWNLALVKKENEKIQVNIK